MYFAGDGGLSDATSIGCYVVTRTMQNRFKLYRVAGWYYSGADIGVTKAMSVQAREICGSFIPYYPDLIRLLFQMRQGLGARFRPDTSCPVQKK